MVLRKLWCSQAVSGLFSTVYINICWEADWENNIWHKYSDFPLKVVGMAPFSRVRSLACQIAFLFHHPASFFSDQAKTIAWTQRSTPWPPQPFAGPLSLIWESCQFRSLVRSEAEASPLTGEESLARLSLSLGVKAVTDPNAYTVVAAFRFILAAWLVSFNEGSRHRIISIPIMRVSQAANYFLFRTLFPDLFFSHHLT